MLCPRRPPNHSHADRFVNNLVYNISYTFNINIYTIDYTEFPRQVLAAFRFSILPRYGHRFYGDFNFERGKNAVIHHRLLLLLLSYS